MDKDEVRLHTRGEGADPPYYGVQHRCSDPAGAYP
jgi:hypothetical protein